MKRRLRITASEIQASAFYSNTGNYVKEKLVTEGFDLSKPIEAEPIEGGDVIYTQEEE